MNVQLDSRATGSGKIATIVYDRQSKLNSLNGAGIKELKAAFQNVAKDTKLRGLIFTGAGPKSFIGGADINELAPIKGFESYNFLVAKLVYKILSYKFLFK